MKSRAGASALSSFGYVCAPCRARLAAQVTRSRTHQKRFMHISTREKLAEAENLWGAKSRRQINGDEPTMLKFLEDRGYVNQIAGEREKTEAVMRNERIGVYVGIDPTAPSMHVGHLVPFMALFWMYANGYHAYSLLGGATAQVGDPTGRTTSRELDNPSRKQNIVRMQMQLKTIWANVHHHLTARMGVELDVGSRRGIPNNNVWLNKLPITEFLRMLGQHSRVGTMLGRDTARHKMEHGDGLSFAELSYPLLQGWDWWELYKQLNVKMQIGGSDQMGNIVAGKEAFMDIARQDQFERKLDNLNGATPIGFTVPLLTTASGQKFGKSAGNAIWLDPEMTSVFDQYQFFLRTHDTDLERYLKLFTFLPAERIEQIMADNAKDPGKRIAGKALAEQVCLALHGQFLTEKAIAESEAIFGRKAMSMGSPEPQVGQSGKAGFTNPFTNPNAPQTNAQTEFERSMTLNYSRVLESFPALFAYAGLVSSRSEGHLLVKSGGAYVASTAAGQPLGNDVAFSKIKHGQKVQEVKTFLLDGNESLIIRVGKWKVKFINVVSDEEWSAGVEKGQAELLEQEKRVSDSSEKGQDTAFMRWARFEAKAKVDEARFEEEAKKSKTRSAELKRLDKAIRAELKTKGKFYSENRIKLEVSQREAAKARRG